MAIIIVLIIGVILYFIIKRSKSDSSKADVQDHWLHYFENLQFSAQDFYKAVQDSLTNHEIPDISFDRKKLSQGGLLSANREYLYVSRKEFAFYVCAAQFGKDFFVSYWFVLKEGGIGSKLMDRVPILKQMKDARSFYQIDSVSMFRESVHGSVVEVIDNITKGKGVRGLTELERSPVKK